LKKANTSRLLGLCLIRLRLFWQWWYGGKVEDSGTTNIKQVQHGQVQVRSVQ